MKSVFSVSVIFAFNQNVHIRRFRMKFLFEQTKMEQQFVCFRFFYFIFNLFSKILFKNLFSLSHSSFWFEFRFTNKKKDNKDDSIITNQSIYLSIIN